MSGKPKDVPGLCNAHLYIADDYGDGSATVRCSLPRDHSGRHEEEFRRGPDDNKKVLITWEHDEREYDGS